MPDAGEGTSVSTLSVETSSNGSSASTWSPSLLQPAGHGAFGDALTEAGHGHGDRHGCNDSFWMGRTGQLVDVQRLAGQQQVRLADRLGLGRVRVDELGDLAGQRLPVVDQLRLGDQFADPVTDDVDAEYRAVLLGHELDRALGLEDLALAVAGQVVGERRDLVRAVAFGRLCLGEADGRHLRVGVGDARDAGVVDRDDRQAGDVLGDQDALGEADVGELRASARRSPTARTPRALVRQNSSMTTNPRSMVTPLLLVAEAVGRRAPADRDEQQLGFERLAALERARGRRSRCARPSRTGRPA